MKRRFQSETKTGYSTCNVLGDMPLMSESECELLKSYLKPNFIMFEWGSGGSTLYFPKFVKEYYSVENLKSWFILVRHNLKKHPDISSKVNLYFIPNDLKYNYEKEISKDIFNTYIESISIPGYKRFDIILIDGENRTRKFCAQESLKYMDDKSILFIHDYYDRPDLHDLESHFDIIDKIETHPSLVVMRKK